MDGDSDATNRSEARQKAAFAKSSRHPQVNSSSAHPDAYHKSTAVQIHTSIARKSVSSLTSSDRFLVQPKSANVQLGRPLARKTAAVSSSDDNAPVRAAVSLHKSASSVKSTVVPSNTAKSTSAVKNAQNATEQLGSLIPSSSARPHANMSTKASQSRKSTMSGYRPKAAYSLFPRQPDSEQSPLRRTSIMVPTRAGMAALPDNIPAKHFQSSPYLWRDKDDEFQARYQKGKSTMHEGRYTSATHNVARRVPAAGHKGRMAASPVQSTEGFRVLNGRPARYSSAAEDQGPNRANAILEPGVLFRGDAGAYIDDDAMDVDEDTQPRQIAMKSTSHTIRGYKVARKLPQDMTGRKAARKKDFHPPSSNEERLFLSSGSSSESMFSSSSTESDDELTAIASEPHPETEMEEEGDDDEIVEVTRGRSYSPPEIEFLENPPEPNNTRDSPSLNAPLPVADNLTRVRQPVSPPNTVNDTPSEALVNAVRSLTFSAAHMPPFPFLRRNLRRGFLHRCRVLRVPTTQKPEEVSVTVRYERIENASRDFFETRMEHWICPLCQLHAPFPTREMLSCHLRWDHPEFLTAWEPRDDNASWFLRLTIPERAPEEKEEPVDEIPIEASVDRSPETDHNDTSFDPFPYVTFSPDRKPPSRRVSAEPAVEQSAEYSSLSISDASTERSADALSAPNLSTAFVAPSVDSSAELSAQSSTRRSEPVKSPDEAPPPLTRSTTLLSEVRSSMTVTASTSTARAAAPEQPSSVRTRDPPPPPASNPLGPAAQPPYLPAMSEYGGPTVYYSCRPGVSPSEGCLFDLLGTLPTAQYGVLAWEVLDREDEIYESDNVRDEYKVMHALWARWIILNRNEFVADYYKGTLKFIEYFWRMIHRAAGWDALRYWLMMLLANRFLTGREVAKLLKEYEKLTDMEHWYD